MPIWCPSPTWYDLISPYLKFRRMDRKGLRKKRTEICLDSDQARNEKERWVFLENSSCPLSFTDPLLSRLAKLFFKPNGYANLNSANHDSSLSAWQNITALLPNGYKADCLKPFFDTVNPQTTICNLTATNLISRCDVCG